MRKRDFSREAGPGTAFLLAQLGAYAASRFAERLSPLQLKPADAGILHLLRRAPGTSQQELSGKLGAHPSRLVAMIDALEERSLVERRVNADDRRQYSLYLTKEGEALMQDLGRIAREHQEDLLGVLSKEEREELGRSLSKLADAHGLTPGVHPGYRSMRGE